MPLTAIVSDILSTLFPKILALWLNSLILLPYKVLLLPSMVPDMPMVVFLFPKIIFGLDKLNICCFW